MKLKTDTFELDLQLFADGAATGSSGDGATSETDGEGVSTSGVNGGVSLPSISRKGVKNSLANVKYGIQDMAEEGAHTADVQTETGNNISKSEIETEEDRLKRYNSMREEFKDFIDKEKEEVVRKRLKNSKTYEENYNKLTPALELLANKYGIDVTDVEALTQAITNDDGYYEQEALERGLDVETLKEMQKLERQNASLKKQFEEQQEQEAINRDIAQWAEEAKEVSKVFPSLNLGLELENPKFISLLKSGVDMQTAYLALHHKELVPQAIQHTAKTVEQKLANKIVASGKMPIQNGVRSQSSTIVKSDVSQLTKADRAEIMRRVAQGEKIRF
ncbi:MAG: hypothetical protein ACTTIO_04335 [Candidatus Fimenecus sp.]